MERRILEQEAMIDSMVSLSKGERKIHEAQISVLQSQLDRVNDERLREQKTATNSRASPDEEAKKRWNTRNTTPYTHISETSDTLHHPLTMCSEPPIMTNSRFPRRGTRRREGTRNNARPCTDRHISLLPYLVAATTDLHSLPMSTHDQPPIIMRSHYYDQQQGFP